jgi:hypothetical protein
MDSDEVTMVLVWSPQWGWYGLSRREAEDAGLKSDVFIQVL